MSNRVIIFDDEGDFGEFVANVARNCSYNTNVVTSPSDFISAITNWHPTHIVLDLHMPQVDGIEVLRVLAGRNTKASIFIVSGSDDKVIEAARRLGLERGLNIVGALHKPVRAADLQQLFDTHRRAEPVRSELARALDENQFLLFYQPKIHLASRQVVGVEALARWRHPERGIVGPDQFIPQLEATGLIDQLTHVVMRDAMAQQRAWRDRGLELEVAINLSARNLHNVELADDIEALCRREGARETGITFELTETAAMSDAVQALDILTRLRLKGFKLSIDDFGTGYSSLVQLQRLPFSEIKIDGSFVAECNTSRNAFIIIKTIVDLAHNLDLIAVAEGIEDERTADVVLQLGCDIGQGYWFGRPMAAEAIPGWHGRWVATNDPTHSKLA